MHLSLFSHLAVPSIAPTVCKTPIQSAQWASHMLNQASAQHSKTAVASSLADVVIKGSGAYGGIETPIVAKNMISAAHQKLLQESGLGGGRAIKFEQKWTIEWDSKCIEELLVAPNGPRCVFANILQFTSNDLRKSVGLDRGRIATNDVLKASVPWMKIKKTGWCLRHGKHCELCQVDEHDAGPHCTDHSNFGKQDGWSGEKARFVYVWVAIMRCIRPKRIYQENVTNYGIIQQPIWET
eukprot:1536887-Karenia_brevis.AAC.1